MSDTSLVAIDIAVLLPADISSLAIELSASLPRAESQGLRLGPDFLPHITLTQQFVPQDVLDAALTSAGAAIAGTAPLPLAVTGAARGSSSVWMGVAATPELQALHLRIMDVLAPFERTGGSEAAFVDGDARPRDVTWVAGYRRDASGDAFSPHITLGHAAELPRIEGVSFAAVTIAACHLGRFCSCRRVLRRWSLD